METEIDMHKLVWKLPARGYVRYAKSVGAVSPLAVDCLGKRRADKINLVIPVNQLESGAKKPIEIYYDLRKHCWVRDNGSTFSSDKAKTRLLMEQGLDSELQRLNTLLSSPQRAHHAILALRPLYCSGLLHDRTEIPGPGAQRAWRRKDSIWLHKRSSPAQTTAESARSDVARAFERMARIDRPVPMHWQYLGLFEGNHHFSVKTSDLLSYPAIRLKRHEVKLIHDVQNSLAGDENRKRILAAQMLAFAHALRLHAADSFGSIFVSAYEVASMKEGAESSPLLQLQVSEGGWVLPMSRAGKMTVADLLAGSEREISFVDGHKRTWVATPSG